MSHFTPKIQTEEINKNKLISKSYKTGKTSLLKKFNYRNNKLVNISPKESNFPYKINYANTETNYSSNNNHSNQKEGNLKNKNETINKKLNEIELDSPELKIFNNKKIKRSENNINKNRIISASLLKNRKRFSLFNNESINDISKKETQINLNAMIEKSIPQLFSNRIQSSRGFLRKTEVEAEKIMKNKNKRKNISFKEMKKNHVKNLDLNLHKNQYKYEYVSTEKNQNMMQKGIYFDMLMKYEKKKKENITKKIKNKDDTDSHLVSIINNLTRKVQFLNSKNNILSNENTMNLLNKEEYFLYQKLKEYFKNDYSIKKFSKSIFDVKNGNKYLLPLFNDINSFNSNNEEKNENEFNKVDEDFKLYKYNDKNYIKRKKLIEVYLNSQLSKLKKDNNIYFPSKLDKLNLQNQNQRKIMLNKSSDKINNMQKFYKKSNNNKRIIFLKSSNKNQLIENQQYQEYKMKIIQESENIINNYHKMINKSSTEFPSKITKQETKTIYNITPIKKIIKNKIKEVKSFNVEKVIKNNKKKIENLIENINSNHKRIRFSNSENKQIIKNKENNKALKVNKSQKNKKREKEKEINDINEKPEENNEQLISNNSSKNKIENIEEKENEKINLIANLSTKNIDKNIPNSKPNNKIANNEDIKNLLNRGSNVFSDLARIYKNKKLSISYINNKEKRENNKIDEKNINKKNELEKNPENKNDSETLQVKKEENNLSNDLKNITISNNMILSESIKKEENKLIAKIEKKRDKTLKLLYSYLKAHIKDIIEKEKIKKLLENPEFRIHFDLLKSQMSQIKKLSSDKSFQSSLSDDEIIDLLCDEVNKDNFNRSKTNSVKSSYVPLLRLKKKKTQKIEIEEKKEDENEEEEATSNKNIEKENEKLKIMETEITLTNELKHHIRETYNKEFRERLQAILDKLESYQELSEKDYIKAFKSNYSFLREEMNQILRDKEREERINSFMNNLDSERNIFDTKWNYCNNKIFIMDNKFESFMGKY